MAIGSKIRADLLLLLTAAIWGFAFVAQRAGMDYIGPFTFNALRFFMGSIPIFFILLHKRPQPFVFPAGPLTNFLSAGLIAGLILFGGASFQQMGMVTTTAGKGGFITGLYIILVPILGLLWKQKSARGTWMGAVLGVIGLYLLSVTEKFSIAEGDLLVFFSAFFWALHVHWIGWVVQRVPALPLALVQFLTCSLLSLVVAILWEPLSLPAIRQAAIPLIYAGFLSVGIGYTLQVVAQRDAHPAHAAIIMSLESVFAVIGGGLLLHERLNARQMVGCALMLVGMLISQMAQITKINFKFPNSSN